MGLPCGMPRGAVLSVVMQGYGPGWLVLHYSREAMNMEIYVKFPALKKPQLCRTIKVPLWANGLHGHFVMSGIK